MCVCVCVFLLFLHVYMKPKLFLFFVSLHFVVKIDRKRKIRNCRKVLQHFFEFKRLLSFVRSFANCMLHVWNYIMIKSNFYMDEFTFNIHSQLLAECPLDAYQFSIIIATLCRWQVHLNSLRKLCLCICVCIHNMYQLNKMVHTHACTLCILSIRNRGIDVVDLVWQTISFQFSFHSRRAHFPLSLFLCISHTLSISQFSSPPLLLLLLSPCKPYNLRSNSNHLAIKIPKSDRSSFIAAMLQWMHCYLTNEYISMTDFNSHVS